MSGFNWSSLTLSIYLAEQTQDGPLPEATEGEPLV